MESNPAIVIIAYNRPKSLKRLLGAISKAYFPSKEIPLIISIDKGKDNQDVLQIAEAFDWQYGEKIVHYNQENLGLRKHVIQCGNLSNTYGNVILLEDDLFVSVDFYNYARQALHFSKDKKYIGGISLYNHMLNVNNRWHFAPIEDGFDNWYFQFASSWGQAWTKDQWSDFHSWYVQNETLEQTHLVPANVTRWSQKSWLKYFIYFLVETDKYFLYPKVSLTTNFSDHGTHVKDYSTSFQVPLANYSNKTYTFSNLEVSQAIYDVFYENKNLHKVLGKEKQDLCVDLQGTKNINGFETRYVLSTKIYNYEIEKSFGCRLKPIEDNLLKAIEGEDIFLYDLSKTVKNPYQANPYKRIMYNIRHISLKDTKTMYKILWGKRIRYLITKVLKLN